ncbi:DUF4247 domain-containing protein [Brevibacillus ginsengisoli]|uniref:DUF4247 domain-containing protein n=1 Tax=Brevibacillus ginsengisoli TaxID=363854 RepID=UPI003CFAA858
MKQHLQRVIQLILLPALLMLMLAGCGDSSVGSSYPLESVTNKDGGQTSRIYRAANQTVPEVAHQLADQRKPDELSKDDPKHMFLVYSDEWYHVQQDEKKPEDTLIEVDSKEFVKKNYDNSFLEGYITASIIGNLFDALRGSSGHYRGYTTRDTYKPVGEYHVPTKSEQKAAPPITKSGSGSIIKRGSNTKSSGTDYSGTTSNSGSSGKITRSSNGSTIDQDSSSNYKSPTFQPRSKSPPRTKSGSGRIKRR